MAYACRHVLLFRYLDNCVLSDLHDFVCKTSSLCQWSVVYSGRMVEFVDNMVRVFGCFLWSCSVAQDVS